MKDEPEVGGTAGEVMEVRYWHPGVDAWLEATEMFVAGGAPQAFVDRIAKLNAEEREITHERDLAYPILMQVAEDARRYYGGDGNLTRTIWMSRRSVNG